MPYHYHGITAVIFVNSSRKRLKNNKKSNCILSHLFWVIKHMYQTGMRYDGNNIHPMNYCTESMPTKRSTAAESAHPEKQ